MAAIRTWEATQIPRLILFSPRALSVPNTWYAVGRLLTDSIVVLQLLALPLKLHRTPGSDIWDLESSDVWSNHWMLVIFCLLVVVSSFVVSCAYWLPWSMIGVLLNPFAKGVDAYNTDALLASTDRMLFVSMRALFDPKAPPDPEEFLEEESSFVRTLRNSSRFPHSRNSHTSRNSHSEGSSEEPSVSITAEPSQSIDRGVRRLGRFHTRLPVKIAAIETPEEPPQQIRRRKTSFFNSSSNIFNFEPRQRKTSKTFFQATADPAEGLDPAENLSDSHVDPNEVCLYTGAVNHADL